MLRINVREPRSAATRGAAAVFSSSSDVTSCAARGSAAGGAVGRASDGLEERPEKGVP
jgi:hypothetical protein